MSNEACRKYYKKKRKKILAQQAEYRHSLGDEYKKRNRERYRRRRYEYWARQIMKRYGITSQQYEMLLEHQKGCCAICKGPEIKKRGNRLFKLSVDHNHRTRKLRGLLCMRCNRAIGMLQESVPLLQAAIAYLKEGL